ncbi:ABC transporter ATP-binding protein [Pukyongiella litopenaei]|uniref:ABC transporter ATP-binding protein n=1 Tax=Pukyongiella litopenaei TaxID=2605946 RepID=A0A2S0MQW4_9RHOB|nr:ABC transporter ATP-binding protein [Pukyongiella litopenaei]
MTHADLSEPMVRVANLTKSYASGKTGLWGRPAGPVRALDDVSLDVRAGETLGLVGESGSGKSTLGRSIVRLDGVDEGRILFQGVDIARLSGRQISPYRRRMQMIFQDTSSSLNPRRRIGDLLAEPLRAHGWDESAARRQRVGELMEIVGLQDAFSQRWPHELSGGQRQRIGIARALALKPDLIIADEPVSALDVSVQAQIVNLFADLRRQFGMTMIFVSHDLSVVRQISDRVAVMYLGSIVECGTTDRLFASPAHPYTQALLSSVPVASIDPGKRRQRIILTGEVSRDAGGGCKFHKRCAFARGVCRDEQPPLARRGDGSQVACHFPLMP